MDSVTGGLYRLSKTGDTKYMFRIGPLLRPTVPAVLSLLCLTSNGFAEVTGIPRVVDGDTIVIGEIRIRLHGIDAPEQQQRCSYKGSAWSCSREATSALKNMVNNRMVSCRGNKKDRYGRLIAECFVSGRNLNDAMVRTGWAVAYRRYSTIYVEAEAQAAAKAVGIWKGEFLLPWKWREERRN